MQFVTLALRILPNCSNVSQSFTKAINLVIRPFYIDEYIALPSVDDFNGGFSRVNNGKSREYTEYIVSGDLDKKFASTGASKEYNKYYTENHFKFAKEDTDIADGTSAVSVDIPFPHNGSYLSYDESEKVYKYFEYKKEHVISSALPFVI